MQNETNRTPAERQAFLRGQIQGLRACLRGFTNDRAAGNVPTGTVDAWREEIARLERQLEAEREQQQPVRLHAIGSEPPAEHRLRYAGIESDNPLDTIARCADVVNLLTMVGSQRAVDAPLGSDALEGIYWTGQAVVAALKAAEQKLLDEHRTARQAAPRPGKSRA